MSMEQKFQQSGASFLANLREAAAQNPIAAALIGAGALWLFARRTPIVTAAAAGGAAAANGAANARSAASDAARSTWRAARGQVSDLSSRAADQLWQNARNASDAAAGAFEAAADAARVLRPSKSENGGDVAGRNAGTSYSSGDETPGDGEAVTARMEEQAAAMRRRLSSGHDSGAARLAGARAQLGEFLEKQPLALGVMGLAIGAGLAAALPETEAENELMGETSDAMREEAKRRMDRAASTAADEAGRRNLTPEALKAEAENAAAKLGGVAESASESLRQTIGSSP